MCLHIAGLPMWCLGGFGSWPEFGNRIPQFTFEVMHPVRRGSIGRSSVISPGMVRGVALDPWHWRVFSGHDARASVVANTVNQVAINVEFTRPVGPIFPPRWTSLEGEMPNCKSSVLCWCHGLAAICGAVIVRLRRRSSRLESGRRTSCLGRVSGQGRAGASDRTATGGPPCLWGHARRRVGGRGDSKTCAVVAIDAVFYPFVLMEQMAGQ